MRWKALLLAAVLVGSAAGAQDFDVAEEEVDFNNANIVVTGSKIRSDFEGYSSSVPLVGYQRQADFLLQPVGSPVTLATPSSASTKYIKQSTASCVPPTYRVLRWRMATS